jgi:sucrose phosphorylase
LVNWLNICPRKQFTTLDTHDGIGVADVAELLSQDEIDRTLEGLYEKGSNLKRIYSGPDYQNLDIYQVNCTYYSALECNDDSYLAARTIQFFTPGIPQVYYVGLLAGENDIELLEKTQLGRNINRHNYTLEEIHEAFKKPVVQRLIRLMKFRTSYPAFNGEFRIEDSPENQMVMTWAQSNYQTTATINLNDYHVKITYSDPESGTSKQFEV